MQGATQFIVSKIETGHNEVGSGKGCRKMMYIFGQPKPIKSPVSLCLFIPGALNGATKLQFV